MKRWFAISAILLWAVSSWAQGNPNSLPIVDLTSLASRGYASVKDFGAKGDGRSVTGLSVNAGVATLTDMGNSPWVASDAGKTIVLYGQTYPGFVTTIAVVTDSAHITLVAAPTRSGSAVATWGTDDSAALVAAFASITGKGGWGNLYFPHGIYLTASPLSVINAQGLTIFGEGAGSPMSLGNWNASAQPGTGSSLVWIGARGGAIGCTGNTGVPPPGIVNAATNCTAAENVMLRLSGQFHLHDLNLIGSQLVSHNIQIGGPEASNSFDWSLARINSGYAKQYCLVLGGTGADQGNNFGEASVDNFRSGGCGVPQTTLAENDATGGGDIFTRWGPGNFQVKFNTGFLSGGAVINGNHRVFAYSGNNVAFDNYHFGPLTSGIYCSVYVLAGNQYTFENIYDENGCMLHSAPGGADQYDIRQVQLRQQTITNPHFGMIFDNSVLAILNGVYTSGLPIVFNAGGKISQQQVALGNYGPAPAYPFTLCAGAGCIKRSGAVVTFRTTTACTYRTGDWVTIADTADPTYEGTFKVTKGCSGGTTFAANNPAAVEASTQSGTVSLACCIIAATATGFTPQISHPFVDLYANNAGISTASLIASAVTNLANKNTITYIRATTAGVAGSSFPATIPAGWHFLDFRGGRPLFLGGPYSFGTTANPTNVAITGTLALGNSSTNNFVLTPAATAAARTVSVNDPLANAVLRLEISGASGAVDLASVANGACSADSSNVTVRGAAVGDSVTVTSGTVLEAGGFLIGRVLAPNTARFQFCNLSGGAIDRATDTYTVRVFK